MTILLALAAAGSMLSGYGQDGKPDQIVGGEGALPEYSVADDFSLPDSPTWQAAQNRGKVGIGFKFDQPGLGNKAVGDDAPEGFDIEVGKMTSAALSFGNDEIEWVGTVSSNREPFLRPNNIDFVITSYTISDASVAFPKLV